MMAAPSSTSGIPLGDLLRDLLPETTVVADVDVTGLQTDSRRLVRGDVFLACQGLNVHGLQHVEQAVAQGAVAIVWESVGSREFDAAIAGLSIPAIEMAGLRQKLGLIADRFYAHPSREMHVIGITGTDGKTSVSHFLAQALTREDDRCGLIGTLGYGAYGDLHTPSHTTPDALRLQAELARMRDGGIRRVAMEVSSHALHQHRSDGVAFNTAVLTQLSRDHLDYHGSVEAYAEAKRRLFTMPGLEAAVLNAGDAFGRRLAHQLGDHLGLIAYGRSADEPAKYAARWIELVAITPRASGIVLQLRSSWGAAEFEAPLLGEFNADNLMAALGALLASGISLELAVERLSHAHTVPGRMELFAQTGTPSVVVDYAHTPNALETALQALRAHCRGDLVCVFGAGGDRDPGKRPQMGAAAERYADRVILTSDNPRSESPEAIMNQIAAGFSQPERIERIADRGGAIDTAIATAAVDDLILVAGKGHEDYQQVGDQRLAFSDRLRVQQAVRRRTG